jgi:hypothetical protein
MTTTRTPMLHMADVHLAAGRWYRELKPTGDDAHPIAIIIPVANGRAVRVDSLDNETHLRIRPALRDGYATREGVEVHIPDPDLVAVAIDAVIEYTKTLEEV